MSMEILEAGYELPAVAQDEHGRHFHPARRRSRSRFSNTVAWGV